MLQESAGGLEKGSGCSILRGVRNGITRVLLKVEMLIRWQGADGHVMKRD